jgi:hypothetical protein
MTTTQNRLAVLFIAVSACLSAYALAHAGHVEPIAHFDVATEVPQSGSTAEGETSVPSAGAAFARGEPAADDPAPTF